MANPKSKDEPIFEEPKFDKHAYLSYERERAKSIILVFITGALVGLLSGELEIYGYWYIAIILIIAIIYFLKRLITLFKIALPKQTSHKILIYAELVITWFVFWIIALNPPLHVASAPQVADMEYLDSGHWAKLNETKDTYYLAPGIPFHLRYHTDYKYSIKNVSLTYNNMAINSTFDRSTGYVTFNITSPSAGFTHALVIKETSRVNLNEKIIIEGSYATNKVYS